MHGILCWATPPVLLPPDQFVPLHCVFEQLKVVNDHCKVSTEDSVDGIDAKTGTLVTNSRAVLVHHDVKHTPCISRTQHEMTPPHIAHYTNTTQANQRVRHVTDNFNPRETLQLR